MLYSEYKGVMELCIGMFILTPLGFSLSPYPTARYGTVGFAVFKHRTNVSDWPRLKLPDSIPEIIPNQYILVAARTRLTRHDTTRKSTSQSRLDQY